MAGYTRQSIADIISGANVTASPLNREFNQLAAAFHPTTGHVHDGTSGNAPLINLATSTTGALPAARGGTGGQNNTTATTNPTATNDSVQGYAPGSLWLNAVERRLWVCTSSAASSAVWTELTTVFADTVISSVVNNTVDLGSDTVRFKDLYLSGNTDITGNLTVGGTTTGTFSGNLTSAGTSTFNNLTVTGTATVAAPVNATDAVTKAYVDAVQNSLDPVGVQGQLDLKADLASPALTGTPTAPTAAANTNTTQIATTAYVQTELTDLASAVASDLSSLDADIQVDIATEASAIRSEFAVADTAITANLNTVNTNIANQRLQDIRWVLASGPTTAQEGQKIAADVSGGPWTLTLPAFPANGSAVTVSVVSGDPSVNNLTIVGNTHNIQGDTSLVWDVSLSPIELTLVYNGTEWRIA